jgi:hypothetical protein
MAGGYITFSGGTTAKISSQNSATSITVSSSITVSAGTTYVITYPVTTVPFVKSGVNIGVAALSTRYLRINVTLDDSSCGSISTIRDIVVYYNDVPNAPTLLTPGNGATSVNILPEFRLSTTDENPFQKYYQYKIDVCSTSNCSSIVRTIDQSSSQTGWKGQSQANATAYAAAGWSGDNLYSSYFTGSITGTVLTVTAILSGSLNVGQSINGTGVTSGTVITSLGTGTGGVGTYNINNTQTVASNNLSSSSIVEYAIHQYQTAALSANTQYWWRGYAMDPEGSKTFSSASSISTFTTGSATPSNVNITGGTNITSGSKISP